MRIEDLSKTELAARFESLGGGSLHDNGWAFGCEFGYFQRDCGVEQLGLLRWASVAPLDLIKALDAGFADVDSPQELAMREHTAWDWGCTQTTYSIRMDHTCMDRAEMPAEQAQARIARALGRLRLKLLEDLAEGSKVFVYRTYDHVISDETLTELARAVNQYGNNTLLYVKKSDGGLPPFQAERESAGLIVATIDHFAPVGNDLKYNTAGWEKVCRRALAVLAESGIYNVT